jgi:hypothetical protein
MWYYWQWLRPQAPRWLIEDLIAQHEPWTTVVGLATAVEVLKVRRAG